MTTDQELLEYAAKAAGVELKYDTFGQGPNADREYCYWNPLTNDGDAFRLSVSLRLPVAYLPNKPPFEPGRVAIGGGHNIVEDVFLDEWSPATRRAIVRAAAEIGKRMIDEELKDHG